MMRFIRPLIALACLGLFCLLTYLELTFPSDLNLYDPSGVKFTTPSQAASGLQVGDRILTFNGQPFYGCRYFLYLPVTGAPRNVPIPIEVWRAGAGTVPATLVLAEASPQELLSRILFSLLGLLFVAVGMITFLGGNPDPPHLLIGLGSYCVGIAWTMVGYNFTVIGALATAGVPPLIVAAHAWWPVNQLRYRFVRPLIGVTVLLSGAYLLNRIPQTFAAGCNFSEPLARLDSWTYQSLGLTLPMLLYLLYSADRRTDNPFSRTQIRAMLWAMGLGFGLFGLLMLLGGLNGYWTPAINLLVFASGIVPVTYLFVFYRGELLIIDRYLNRMVFTAFFLIFWGGVTLATVNAILAAQPEIDPLLLAGVAAVPPLLAATVIRDRIGLLVDLALYGRHYDAEAVIAQLGRALAGVLNEADLARVVVQQLPQALSIRRAALWLAVDGSHLRLAARSEDSDPAAEEVQDLSVFPSGTAEVEALKSPVRVGADSTDWQVIVRLTVGSRLAGLVLLGAKVREALYSEQDVRTLKILAGWLATTVASLHWFTEQRRLMLELVAHEERIRLEVARELHDRGISALGMVRLMSEQERGRAILSASLERVIEDLRELSDHRLNPIGLHQNLPQALEALADMHRQLGGALLSLQVGLSDHDLARLPPTASRELFYIAREALINAQKYANARTILLRLVCFDRTVQLIVQDDGQGFENADGLTGRQTRGLGIMQARAHRLGGILTVRSEPGLGTTISVAARL
jgi:signal transduction histidine kinase